MLLIGPNGQIGYELRHALEPIGQVVTAGRTGAEVALDLMSPDSLKEAICHLKADVIINAAAYTRVDHAESDRDAAFTVNAQAPEVLARCAKESGALLVHFSTDYVFDGKKRSAYVEIDRPNPLSHYGRSKLAGEEAVLASGAKFVILRTSWVYGLRGKNFLLTVLRLAADRDELRVVNDQFGVPNWSRALAVATASVIAAMRGAPGEMDRRSGIYHLSAAGETTWHGFAETILDSVRNEPGIRADTVRPISTREFPTAAARPARSTLDSARLEREFGVRMPDWRACLDQCLGSRPDTDPGKN